MLSDVRGDVSGGAAMPPERNVGEWGCEKVSRRTSPCFDRAEKNSPAATLGLWASLALLLRSPQLDWQTLALIGFDDLGDMSTGEAAGGGGGGSSQSLHDLEVRYLTLLKEHEQEKASCIAAKASTEQAQCAVAELRAKYEGACRAVSEKDFEAKLKDNLIKEAEQLTEELKERNLQRTEECDRWVPPPH